MQTDPTEAHREYANAKLMVNRRNWRAAMLQTAESLETQAKVYRTMAEEGKGDKPSSQLFSMTVTAERDGTQLRRALAADILRMVDEMRTIEGDLANDG